MSARLSFEGFDVVPHDRKPLFKAVRPLDELVVLLDLCREASSLTSMTALFLELERITRSASRHR